MSLILSNFASSKVKLLTTASSMSMSMSMSMLSRTPPQSLSRSQSPSRLQLRSFYSTSPSNSNSTQTNNSYGAGMTQHDLMKTDLLITVSPLDRLTPSISCTKEQGHTFNSSTPNGVTHRAFSVFIFDEENRMLVTQRAEGKITFPGVWTNACCSHPLYGQIPDEVDDNDADVNGNDNDNGITVKSKGAKNAASRKLQHELGIRTISADDFTFLTRFHYWAKDTVTYGHDGRWGENEVDYILFNRSTVSLSAINQEEVSSTKYVTQSELREMMNDRSILWSPWFRGIMDSKGFEFWDDIEGILDGSTGVEGGGFADIKVHSLELLTNDETETERKNER